MCFVAVIWEWTSQRYHKNGKTRNDYNNDNNNKIHTAKGQHLNYFFIFISGLLFDQIYSFQLEKFFV